MSVRRGRGGGVGDGAPAPTHDTRGCGCATTAAIVSPPFTIHPVKPPPPAHIRFQCFKNSIALPVLKGSQEPRFFCFGLFHPSDGKGTVIVSTEDCGIWISPGIHVDHLEIVGG